MLQKQLVLSGDWLDSCFRRFTSREEPPVAIGHMTWTSETVWTSHGREKSVGMAGFERFSSVTVLDELS